MGIIKTSPIMTKLVLIDPILYLAHAGVFHARVREERKYGARCGDLTLRINSKEVSNL
jgi:hypothetical protein